MGRAMRVISEKTEDPCRSGSISETLGVDLGGYLCTAD